MSLVGTRPPTVDEWDKYELHHRARLATKPGLYQPFWFAFLFSLTIEFLQLFLRLGTFQLSDLCYNTLGGAMGGVLYWMGWKVKK